MGLHLLSPLRWLHRMHQRSQLLHPLGHSQVQGGMTMWECEYCYGECICPGSRAYREARGERDALETALVPWWEAQR